MTSALDISAAIPRPPLWLRVFAWAMVAFTCAFVLDSVLTFWVGMPGAGALFRGDAALSGGVLLSALQLALYGAAVAGPVLYVRRTPDRPLRYDADIMSRIVRFLIRFAFWSVLLVGLADLTVSFLRVEQMLGDLVGAETAAAWGFNENRAPQLHLPMIGIALLLAITTPTLGFQWLTLFVVLAELSIVITRFVFSYEQAFQADLVRFWYGSLFLFASAYTLVEDGHVRVDVVYAALSTRTQGMLNVIGCLLMGILFCWVILYFGMQTRSSVITAPLLSLEVTQAGFGMYVKYLMAGFLAVFGVTMMIQFCAYLLESWADWQGVPGGHPHHVHGEDQITEV
ncbi:MAG: TRAP transporter small permease subunit [Pikeienuella sp.]